MSDETLNKTNARQKLNAALSLQYRSACQYTTASGSLFGFEFQGLGDRLWAFGQAELADARLLVEKVVALGGEPVTDVAGFDWAGDAEKAVEQLIENEQAAISALQSVIPETGKDAPSEALEHLMEHLILRKQNQIDFLVRARRRP